MIRHAPSAHFLIGHGLPDTSEMTMNPLNGRLRFGSAFIELFRSSGWDILGGFHQLRSPSPDGSPWIVFGFYF